MPRNSAELAGRDGEPVGQVPDLPRIAPCGAGQVGNLPHGGSCSFRVDSEIPNLLPYAATEWSVRILPTLSRISNAGNGFWIKCQLGFIVSASGGYPDIRTTFISGRDCDNCAAISAPFILPGITTSEIRRSICP